MSSPEHFNVPWLRESVRQSQDPLAWLRSIPDLAEARRQARLRIDQLAVIEADINLAIMASRARGDQAEVSEDQWRSLLADLKAELEALNQFLDTGDRS